MMLLTRGMCASSGGSCQTICAYSDYYRMNQTMERLKRMDEKDYTTLIRVLFGLDSPTPLPLNLEDAETGSGSAKFIDPTLNDSQKDAIKFALASREVALIHGPPGVSAHTCFIYTSS